MGGHQAGTDSGAGEFGDTSHTVMRTGAWLVAACAFAQTVTVGAPPESAPKPDRYALVVGIGSYSNSSLPDVLGKTDAENLAGALEKYGGFPTKQIVVLTDGGPRSDGPPKRDVILKEATRISREASVNGTVLFAFSGHGFEDDGEDYLVPIGVDPTDRVTLRAGSVRVRDLLDALQAGQPNELMLFIDACRQSLGSTANVRRFANRLDITGNVAALFATSQGFPSQVRADSLGGFFIKAVVDRMHVSYRENSRMGIAAFAKEVQQDVRAQTRTRCQGCQEQNPAFDLKTLTPSEFLVVDPSGTNPSNLVTVAGSRVLVSPDGSEVHMTDERTGEVVVYSRARALAQPAAAATGERPSLSGSTVVGDGARGQVYVADEARSRVLLFARRDAEKPAAVAVPGGKPDLMVLRRSTRQLYVADSELHAVHVIDVATSAIVSRFDQRFPIPTRITGLALSPDERFLYVGNQGGEGSGLLGSISIIDLEKGHFLDEEIGDVNCPEGMDFGPDGRQLFVASQCGGGFDPLFFVDVATKSVTGLSGFAVGRSVAVDARHGKVYVARVGMYTRDPSGILTAVPAQLSGVDIAKRESLFSFPLDVHSFAMTPGDRYLLAAGGQQLHVVDTDSNKVVKTVFFTTAAAGVAVSAGPDGRNAVCYVWLPEENRLFFTGLSGLAS
jgi:DNA-binding beta-propeller fold protein YncE